RSSYGLTSQDSLNRGQVRNFGYRSCQFRSSVRIESPGPAWDSEKENDMTTSTRLKGHALMADGAAFSQDGERLFPGKTGGWGHGRCECGIICAETDTRKARVEWHRKHRAKGARAASAPAPATRAPGKTEAPASGTKVEFTAAKKWWRALGQDGSTVLLSDFKDVTVAFDKDARTVILQGDAGSVAKAAGFLQDTWE